MSDYASPLGTVAIGQGDQVTKANALFDAASPASMYGRNNATCTGLTWGYHGGKIMLNGVPTAVASGTVALTASSTNYIEVTPASGVVSVNTTGFTAGRVPLYTVTTGASSANNDWVDKRVMPLGIPGYLAKSISDANTTLTQAEDANDILVISGTLTATRNVVISLHPRQRTVHNNTSNDVQFIGATGTGVTVASGHRAVIYSDGTNVVRVTSETVASPSGSGLDWFNVMDYGAAGDGTTDDTTEIQAAIDAAISAGGGVVYFPRGVYVVGGALQDTSRSNAQLLLPRLDAVDTEQITIELRGEFAPPPIMSVVGSTPLPDGHSIIKGTLNTASGTAPSLIGAWGPSGTIDNLSMVHVVVRDLTFRMPSNPQLSACNFQNAATVDVDRVVVDCGGYYVQGLTEPTTSASVGMRLPTIHNGANTRLGTVDVIGFYTGYLFNEHTIGENVKAWGCKIAATFAAADHPSYFTRFMAVHCEKVLTATGEHYVDFGQLDIEHATTGWWVTDYDIDDSSNYLNGDMAWHVVLAGTGSDDTFTVNGAKNMRRKRVGKWFAYQLTDAATISVPAQISSDFRVTLGGNRTLGNPTGMQDGQVFSIRIQQDGTGGRTLAFASKWKLIGTAASLATTANARWYLSGQYDAADDTINYTIQNVAS